MSSTSTKDYLRYLEKEEKRLLFSFKKLKLSKGQLSSYFRAFKGMLFGFGLGNLLILKTKSPSLLYGLIILLLFFTLSVLLINYEKRAYKRKNFKHTLKKTLRIFLACLLFSLLVFFYSNFNGFIIVLASTLFFASLAYSME